MRLPQRQQLAAVLLALLSRVALDLRADRAVAEAVVVAATAVAHHRPAVHHHQLPQAVEVHPEVQAQRQLAVEQAAQVVVERQVAPLALRLPRLPPDRRLHVLRLHVVVRPPAPVLWLVRFRPQLFQLVLAPR